MCWLYNMYFIAYIVIIIFYFIYTHVYYYCYLSPLYILLTILYYYYICYLRCIIGQGRNPFFEQYNTSIIYTNDIMQYMSYYSSDVTMAQCITDVDNKVCCMYVCIYVV